MSHLWWLTKKICEVPVFRGFLTIRWRYSCLRPLVCDRLWRKKRSGSPWRALPAQWCSISTALWLWELWRKAQTGPNATGIWPLSHKTSLLTLTWLKWLLLPKCFIINSALKVQILATLMWDRFMWDSTRKAILSAIWTKKMNMLFSHGEPYYLGRKRHRTPDNSLSGNSERNHRKVKKGLRKAYYIGLAKKFIQVFP